MPLPVDQLTPESPENVIQDAIGASIEACMKEPIPEGYDVQESNKQKWCAGKVYGIARTNTGKSLGEGTQR